MPEEETNNKLNSFDKEPPTGSSSSPSPHGTTADSVEHADLNHRLEANPVEEPVATEPQWKPVPQPTAAPIVAAPVASSTGPSAEAAQLPHAGPGMLVLQWLTYAFWGWTVLSLSGLIILVVNQLVKSDSDGGMYWFGGGIAYLLAAVIVLFIISLICDIFYARAEKKHARTSGTNVIMIIHAVLFALFGIGALIMSVFGAVNLMIGETSDSSGAVSTIISGGIIFVLYGLSLLRTLRPSWIKGVVPVYWLAMTFAIIVSIILGVVGPVATTRLQNQDTVIEEGLPSIATAISSLTKETSALPRTLDELKSSSGNDLSEQAKELIADNKVTYTPGEELASNNFRSLNLGMDQQGGTVSKVYAYELCVTYNAADEYGSYSSSPYVPDGERYATTIETYGHKAGKTCYDLQTDYLGY